MKIIVEAKIIYTGREEWALFTRKTNPKIPRRAPIK
jgi:hypothetical protein